MIRLECLSFLFYLIEFDLKCMVFSVSYIRYTSIDRNVVNPLVFFLDFGYPVKKITYVYQLFFNNPKLYF